LSGREEEKLDAITPESSDSHDEVAEREHQQKRVSSYSFSNLPEVVPNDTYQGLQHVPTDRYHGGVVGHDDSKEAVAKPTVFVENLPEFWNKQPEYWNKGRGNEEAVSLATEPAEPQKPQTVGRLNRRVCGVRAKWALLGLATLVLLIIVLGAGLGAGLKSR
jgi:hypothetical protein